MINNLIYSANAVLPIFLMFAFGYFLKAIGFLTQDFIDSCDKFVYRISLPFLVFTQLAFAQKKVLYGKDLYAIFICCIEIFVLVGILLIITPLFYKNPATRGAFIQGVYRSNFAVLGLPLAGSLFGDKGTTLASFMLACAIPIYNILAIIILSINNPERSKYNNAKNNAVSVIKDIFKNPLIIATIIAIPFFVFKLDMPSMFKQSINYVANTATPLALMTIGANFDFSKLKGKITAALTCVVLKMAIIPFILVCISAMLGLRNEQLGLIFIVFGSPTAITSYTMAKSMNSDHQLASQIIILTSVTAVFSIFIGSFVMKQFGLI